MSAIRIIAWILFWPILIFRRNPLKRAQQSIEDPGAALSVLLQGHGLATTRDRDWIVLAGSEHRARVELLPGTNPRKGELVNLVFSFEFGRGERLVISVPGFGGNYIEAVPDAWRSFAVGSLPVILKAFLAERSRQARQEELTIAGRRWLVTRGKFVLRPAHISPRRLPRDLPERLQQMIEELPLGSGIHWVQIYYSQAGNSRREYHEALFDNQALRAFETELAEIAFPDLRESYSVSQLIVLMPIGRAGKL